MKYNSNASGIIPLRRESGEWKVFLIHHLHYEQFWGCPKGHVEPNETPEQAALRELEEETGLQIERFLHKDPLLEEFYWFRNDEKLLKRVLFFVAEVKGEVQLQKEEIAGGQWFALPDAIQKVAHPEGKATLKQVELILSEY